MSRLEQVAVTAAAALGVAIWLPWPHGDDPIAERPVLSFLERGDGLLSISALTARPLLDPSRKGASGAASGGATGPEVRVASDDLGERLVLRGIAKVGNVDIAVIEDRRGGRPFRVQKGQLIGDWYFAELREEAAVLRKETGEERVLPLASGKPRGQ